MSIFFFLILIKIVEMHFDDVKRVGLFSFLFSVLKILQTVRSPGQRQAIGIEVRKFLYFGSLPNHLHMHLGSTCRGCLSFMCPWETFLIDAVVLLLCNLLSSLLVISGKFYPFLHLVQLHTSNRTASKPSNSSWSLLTNFFLDWTHFCYILV